MRSSLPFILCLSFLLIIIFQTNITTTVSAATSPRTAYDGIVQAFAIVRDAESRGVSHADIVQLSAELDTAYSYYENATRLQALNNTQGAADYATRSVNLSFDVSTRALALGRDAQEQRLLRQELAYATSAILGVVTAYTMVEFDRIRVFLRRRKLSRFRLRWKQS